MPVDHFPQCLAGRIHPEAIFQLVFALQFVDAVETEHPNQMRIRRQDTAILSGPVDPDRGMFKQVSVILRSEQRPAEHPGNCR
jgi:hypothetical protein